METITTHTHDPGEHFNDFNKALQQSFTALFEANPYVYRVDTKNLYTAYLEGFKDEVTRQHHNCQVCRQFIRTYGGAVFIDNEGNLTSIWNPDTVPEVYQASVARMKALVEPRPVKGILVDDEAATWGRPVVNAWDHLYLPRVNSAFTGSRMLGAASLKGSLRERYKLLNINLAQFDIATILAVVNLLTSEKLPGTKKYRGWIDWFHQMKMLREAREHTPVQITNLQWLNVTTVPDGWVELRNSVLGELLDSVENGENFSTIERKYLHMTRADRYQRPQAAPVAGNLEVAERTIERLDMASALARRFATREEVRPFAIWTPTVEEAAPVKGSVFGHLKSKDEPKVAELKIPPVTMTWEKFTKTVLPEAKSIKVVFNNPLMTLGGIMTAVDADAKPILKWDRQALRNPFSWYFNLTASRYGQPPKMGIHPRAYKLGPGTHEVEMIIPDPAHFYPDYIHPGFEEATFMFVLKDSVAPSNTGLCLFPGILISELYPIRASIEALSKSQHVPEGGSEAATGLFLNFTHPRNNHLVVTTDTGERQVIIDRMD